MLVAVRKKLTQALVFAIPLTATDVDVQLKDLPHE
jgi:hypothetical protein